MLGPAAKPETDDAGDAPASGVVAKLCEAGVRVRAYDPHAVPRADQWRASGWTVHRLGERCELDDPPDGVCQET